MRDLAICINYKRYISLSLFDQLLHSSDILIEMCDEELKRKILMN